MRETANRIQFTTAVDGTPRPGDRKRIPALWMGAGLGIAIILAAGVLGRNGINEDGLRLALRVTARWSFLLFWPAYCGSALATLWGQPFARMARRGREFGLAYAAAQLVHLGLVFWLFEMLSHLPIGHRLAVFFGIGIFWTYLLAIFSFGDLAEAVGPGVWRALRLAGVNYILFAFALDFVRGSLQLGHGVEPMAAYLPFALMCVAAPIMLLVAAARDARRPVQPKVRPAVNSAS